MNEIELQQRIEEIGYVTGVMNSLRSEGVRVRQLGGGEIWFEGPAGKLMLTWHWQKELRVRHRELTIEMLQRGW